MIHARRGLDAATAQLLQQPDVTLEEGLPVIVARCESSAKEAHNALIAYSRQIVAVYVQLARSDSTRAYVNRVSP